MSGYRCSVCLGDCDPGELEGGICHECRSAAAERNDATARLAGGKAPVMQDPGGDGKVEEPK